MDKPTPYDKHSRIGRKGYGWRWFLHYWR